MIAALYRKYPKSELLITAVELVLTLCTVAHWMSCLWYTVGYPDGKCSSAALSRRWRCPWWEGPMLGNAGRCGEQSAEQQGLDASSAKDRYTGWMDSCGGAVTGVRDAVQGGC